MISRHASPAAGKSTTRRSTSTSDRPGASTRRQPGVGGRSTSSTPLYVGLGVGGLLLIGIVIALLSSSGSGGGSNDSSAPAPKGLQIEMEIAGNEILYSALDPVAMWTIHNHTGQPVNLTYTIALRHRIVKEDPVSGGGLGALPRGSFAEPPPAKTQTIPAGGRHQGKVRIPIEALDVDESRFRRLLVALRIVLTPTSGASAPLTSNEIEVIYRRPNAAEFKDYVGRYDSADAPQKRRMLSLVSRHTRDGYEEVFRLALADKSPSVRLLAAEFALDRGVAGAEETIQGWNRMKPKDEDQKKRLEALLARVGVEPEEEEE